MERSLSIKKPDVASHHSPDPLASATWVDIAPGVGRRIRDRLVRALAAQEVWCQEVPGQDITSKPQDSTESVPGVLLIAQPDPTLVERVRRASLACQGRLLLVSCGDCNAGSRAAEPRAGDLDPWAPNLWGLLAMGAADLLPWEGPAATASTLRARLDRWWEIDRLVRSPAVQQCMVGGCSAWRAVLSQLVEVARFTDASVLVTGESGTGKELAARLVHTLDGREPKGELVLVDCTTLSPELAGSELFGHQRGAFTQAHQHRDGAFALADGGTLFLDEVGELPPRLQAELLRVVQEGTYKPLGSDRWKTTHFRLVCATHRDLVAEVEAGRFRADLFWRLATWTVRLPALRHRRDDIPQLVEHFLRRTLGRRTLPPIDPQVMAVLTRRDYPGNVRDLQQLVTRIAHRHVGDGPITVGLLPIEERPREPILGPHASDPSAPWSAIPLERLVRHALDQGATLQALKDRIADTAVRLAVAAEPNQTRAAERLGVSRRAVQLRLASLRQRSPQSSVPG